MATVGYRFIAQVEVSEDGQAALESPGKLRTLSEEETTGSHSEPTPDSVGVQPLTPITSEVEHKGRINAGGKSRRWLVASAAVVIVGVVAAELVFASPAAAASHH